MHPSSPITLAVLLITAAALPPAATAQQFEGIITQRTVTVDRDALSARGIELSASSFDLSIDRLLTLERDLVANGEMTVTEVLIKVKGRRIRTDVVDDEGPAYALVDFDTGRLQLVRPSERTYIDWSKDEMEQMGASEDGAGPAPRAIPAGRTRTVNGMRAVAYDVTTDEGVTRVWVTEDEADVADLFRHYAEWAAMMDRMSEEEADPSFLVADHGFPVLVQRLTDDTYEVEEVVAVDRRAIPSAEFVAPAGYRRMTMADLMGDLTPHRPPDGASGVAPGDQRSDAGIWVDYVITGDANVTGREVDVALCSETDDGLQARTLGEWVIDLEADGSGPGRHEASLTVAAPESARLHDDDFRTDHRLTGRGTITVRPAGSGAMGFPLLRIEFSADGLHSEKGYTINVRGTLSCPLL